MRLFQVADVMATVLGVGIGAVVGLWLVRASQRYTRLMGAASGVACLALLVGVALDWRRTVRDQELPRPPH